MEKAPRGAFFLGAADAAQAASVDIPGRIRAADDAGGLGLLRGVLTMFRRSRRSGSKACLFCFLGREIRSQTTGGDGCAREA
jgi:hypothetical protein